MAEKVKKVELRDTLRNEVAFLLMQERGLAKIGRSKEGLVIEEVDGNGEAVNLVIRVIQKKAVVENADIVEWVKWEDLDKEADELEEMVEIAEGKLEDLSQG